MVIRAARRLVALSGLEQVVGIQSLSLHENPVLESLDGVRLDTSVEGITLRLNPRLYDLDPLRSVETVQEGLNIVGCGVRDLDVLSSLNGALGGVDITDNPELTDARGLNRLSLTQSLSISGDASLRRLPAFTNLVSPSEVYIEDNPELEAVTLDSPGLWFPLRPDVRGRSLERSSAEVVLIAGNAKLEGIAFPEAYPVARVLAIQENPSLARIELGNLDASPI